MARGPQDRTGFLALILFFLWFRPIAWLGGLAAAAIFLIVFSTYGRQAAIGAAVLSLGVAVVVHVTLDRREQPGRRLFTRGRRTSPRRIAALATALTLVAGVAVGIALNMTSGMRENAESEMRSRSAPGGGRKGTNPFY
jgi:hypothetical protein